MIVNDENIDKFIELKRKIESTLARVDHRLEIIERSKNQGKYEFFNFEKLL